MALSGNSNYTLDRDALIGHVYRNRLAATRSGGTPTSDEISDATIALNLMLKAWQVHGLQLWVIKEAILIPELSKQSYSLGLTGDHCSLSMKKTEVKVAGVTSDTNLDVDSTADMTASDNIGVVLDDGTIHWTTVSSVTDSDTVVLTTGLPSATAVDNHVYNYTTKIDRPHELAEAYRREWDTVVDVPITRLSREEYYTLSDKDSQGVPVNYYYDPQLTNSVFYNWTVADSSFAKNNAFVLLIKKPFDDMDSATDNLEFPQEWYEAVADGLAVRIAPSIGLPIQDRRELKSEAKKSLSGAMGFDVEQTSVFFTP